MSQGKLRTAHLVAPGTCSSLQLIVAYSMTKKIPTQGLGIPEKNVLPYEKYKSSILTDRVTIKISEAFGRTLRSTFPVPKGSVVFEEAPLLLSLVDLSAEEEGVLLEHSERTGLSLIDDVVFLKTFCSADSTTRESVMDCYAPGAMAVESSSLLKSLLEVVNICSDFAWSKGYSEYDLERAVLIKACNAHGCFSHGSSAVALYTLGSKMRHSCSPNVVYTSQREPGKGFFVANRDIRAGEELFITYIDLYRSARMRNLELRENYLFQCDCERCIKGLDMFRGILCGVPSCTGSLFRNQATSMWRCQECGRTCSDETKPISDQHEDILAQEVRAFISSFNVNIPASMRIMRRRLLDELGPFHCLTKMIEKAYIEHHLLRNMNAVVESSDELESLTDGILEWCENDPSFLDSTLVQIACGLAVCGKFEKAFKYLEILLEDMQHVFGETCDNNETLETVKQALAACTACDVSRVPDVIISTL